MDGQFKSKLGWTVALLVFLGLVVLGVAWILPDMMAGVSAALDPGVTLKSAAKYAFVLTLVVLGFFAVVAGDGLLGEIQYILPAFFTFFIFNWLLIAWVF
ncbi:MAG: hypothetical protein L7T24_04425 [Luminiphilus sp.]|nr:hypothetical protein [Luminiphilus sp.]